MNCRLKHKHFLTTYWIANNVTATAQCIVHSYSGHKLCSTEITSNLVKISRIYHLQFIFLMEIYCSKPKSFEYSTKYYFPIIKNLHGFLDGQLISSSLLLLFAELLFPGESFTLINTLKQMLLSGLLPYVLPLPILLPTSFSLKWYWSCIPYAKQREKLHFKILLLYI